MNLLIVDDHLINLKLLRTQLEAESHVVFEAHDGVDALALLERQRVDAVISDILMPQMDGYSLCYEIRKRARLRDLPIIIYSSAYTSPGDEKLALEMGADKYLKKPVSVETIITALHEVIAQPHAAPRPDELREVETFKNYNERLVSKLKEKNTELQAQTEVLRESELQYRTLADSGRALIWSSGLDKKCDYLNQPWLMFTGRTLEQELGDGWAEGVHPDDLARCFEIYTTAFDRRECFSMDYRLRRHDGEFRWIQDDGSPRYDSQWNFLGYIGHCLDITARKQAEEENKTILRTMIDGFYLVDLEGRILEANDAYCAMIGYSREELRKIGVKGVEAIDTQEVIKQRIQRILETGSDRFETKHRRKDGRVIDVEASVTLIKELGRFFVFMRDITARKQAERQVVDAMNYAQTLLAASPIGIITYKASGQAVSANAEAARIIGTTVENVQKQNFRELDSWKNSGLLKMAELALATGQPQLFEGQTVTSCGVERFISCRFVPFLFAGEPHLLVLSQDIAERKQAEEVLTFLASASTGRADEPFFNTLARYLAQSLGMDFVCIDRLEGEGLNARTVAVWCDGKFEDNVTYALKDTPCGDVVGKTACCFPASVCQFFPHDKVLKDLRAESYVGVTLCSHTGQPIGLIAVIGRTVLANCAQAEAMLKMVAVRAASELERLDAMQALRDSEERFKNAEQVAHLGHYVIDLKTGKAKWSEENFRIFGMEPQRDEEPTVETYQRLLHPDDVAVVYEHFGRSLRDGVPFDLVYRIHTVAGEMKFVHSLGHVATNGRGEAVTMFGTMQDITERKQAEAALAESEARFRATFEQAAVGMSQVGLDGRWLRVNQRICDIVGYSREELLSTKFQDITHPDDLATDLGLVQQVLAGELQTYSLEKRYIRKNGSIVPVNLTVSLVREPSGKPQHFISVVENITERKLAEAELQLSQQRLLLHVEQTPLAVIEFDLTGRVRQWNPAAVAMFGFSREEAIGQSWSFIVPAGIHGQLEGIWSAIVSQRGGNRSINENITKDGRTIHCEWFNTPLVGPDGRTIGVASLIQDITERRLLEDQLRQTQKMEAIGRLASGVAHDFNNILAVIQLQAGLLKAEQNISAKQLDFAVEIEKATQRAADLTRQLLLFSRKQALQPRDLDLNEVVTSITKMLQRTLGEDVEMQFKFSPQPLLIHADAGMMDQILMNLTINARDAMPKGGQLLIETSAVEFDEITAAQTSQARPGSFACVSVSDTGGGIPPEILPQIFEPFFTTKAVGKGTGLGLATVFGIVQQHQGWINVYSEAGQGTTFRIYFPRLTKASDKKANWSSLASIRSGNETILLVEDDSSLRASIRIALSRFGYRVLEASNGPEALEVWKQHRAEIRLLLTDLVMPGGLTGKELGEQLLQQDPKLKVIYASGYSADSADKDFSMEEGVNFLTKPFAVNKLAQTVRNCLDKI